MQMKTNFLYEKMSTRTRFEKEAKGNSEMAYYFATICTSHACDFHFDTMTWSDKIWIFMGVWTQRLNCCSQFKLESGFDS